MKGGSYSPVSMACSEITDPGGIVTTSKRITADSVVLTGLELENQVHCKIFIIKNITDPFVSRKELCGAPGNT